MAAGVPVVAGDIPSTRDMMIHNETGLLVQIGDCAGFAGKPTGCWKTETLPGGLGWPVASVSVKSSQRKKWSPATLKCTIDFCSKFSKLSDYRDNRNKLATYPTIPRMEHKKTPFGVRYC